MKRLLTLLSCLAVLLPLTAFAEPGGLQYWEKTHPQAAQALGAWVRGHPQAASRFFEWDGAHPDRSKEFVTWAITHPRDNIDGFVMNHRGWQYFDAIMEQHRNASMAFIAWARQYGRAAEDLMNHPGGLRWAGDHLYRNEWHLEHPRR